jgi:AraC-like DNA-binding protein
MISSREATSDLCAVLPGCAPDDFHVASVTVPFDKALFTEARGSTLQYHRMATHVAHDGLDHYMVTLCVEGRMEFSSGRRTVALRRGDFCLVDMAEPNRTSLIADGGSGHSRLLNVVLPRAMLAPLLASPDTATASLVSRESLQSRILADQFFALYRRDSTLKTRSAVTSDAVAGLVADAVGAARDAEWNVDAANRALLTASIKRYIDDNSPTGMIGVEDLCRRFRLSRATLYRLFEPDGGLWHHLQEQRLTRAFRLLASSSVETKIMDLAVAFRFSSDSTFARAFRRRFGVAPGEIRQLARSGAARRAADISEIRTSLAKLQYLAE